MKKYYLTKEQLSLPDELQHRQILLLWTTEAEQRLWAQEPPVPVSAKARTQLSRLLFQRLLYLADSVMKALPQERMIARNPLLQWDMRLATQAEKAQTSKELLTEWEETRGESLFLKVPLLRNMLDECVCRFTEFVGEIFLRVACHRDEITKLLFDGADFGSIVHMHCANTDLHFHGRSTMMIETEGGSFFYKPRDCRIDILFGGLVEKWFSGLTHVPRTIVGEGYGICETIVATPVHSMEEIEQYFENMGGLFAIAQALGSSDLHSENLIAHGTFPVVVDLETILTPFTKVFNDPTIYPNVPSGEVTFTDDLNASLYASALLPNLRFNDESSVLLDEKQSNLPVLYGVKHSVRGHEQALFKGFSDTYDLCISLREELLQELELFREIPIRRVIRNTDYYAKIQKRLMAPSALQSTATQKAITQNLGNYFLRHGATHLLGIADWEELCLLEGDIPYFYVTGEETSLLSYNGEIAGDFFSQSAVGNAQKRICNLSTEEKHFELALLRESLDCTLVLSGEKPERSVYNAVMDAPLLTDQEALTEAEKIFLRIRDHGIKTPCGEVFWLENTGSPGTNRPMRPTLFQGTIGLGLFFAAIAAVSKEEDLRQQGRSLAKDCVKQAARNIRMLSLAHVIPEELCQAGLAQGFAGDLRGLILMGRYLNDAAVTECALEMLTLLNPEQIAAFTFTDVITGMAGLLMVLCQYEELRESEQGRTCIQNCSNALLSHRTLSTANGVMLWDTLQTGRPISGMGHGMAGIAVALLRAGTLLGREDCIAAAHDALRFEHEVYAPLLKTWPDFRESAKSEKFMHGFCSGAPGIGLALLDCKKNGFEPPFLDEDIARVFDALNTYPLHSRDHLCCGNSAAVDFLLEAKAHDAAREKLSQMVARKGQQQEFSYLTTNYKPIFVSSLFYGAAGVGYELLRLVEPEKILSILI